MKADQQTEAAAMAVWNKFNDAYVRRDLNELLSVFAPDADVVLFGTGRDERRMGSSEIQAQAKRDWAQSEGGNFRWKWHSVSAAGPVAWLAAEGTFQTKVGGHDTNLPIRLTGVLEKRGDKWLFVQSHASVPAGGQGEGQSFPA